MPNYISKDLIVEKNIVQIPFKGTHIQKLVSLLERVGICEDYLDNAFEYLKEDIIFATSGGELGSLLKNKIHCKF